MIIENSYFAENDVEALFNFIYFTSIDDFVFRNNTLFAPVYLDIETRPFVLLVPSQVCDPEWRSHKIIFDNNKFIDLNESNLIFKFDYMTSLKSKRSFSL